MEVKEQLLFLIGKVKFFYALSLTVENEHSSIDGVLIKEQQGEFHIVQEFKNMPLDKIKNETKSYPVILSVLGEGVVTKVGEDKEGFLKKIFFNRNLDDFYTCDRSYKIYRIISFCRRDTLNFQLDKLADLKIIYISLGISDLVAIKPFIDAPIISYKRQGFDFNNNQLLYSDTLSDNNCFEIGGERIKPHAILPIAGYISYKKDFDTLTEREGLTSFNREEVKYGRKFSLIVPILVLLMLVLTVSGHFIKNSLLEEKFLREGELESLKRTENLINTLNADLKRKQHIYAQSGFNNKFYIVRIISAVGNSVPSTIKLDGINFQPVLNNIREDKVIELGPGILRVIGRSENHDSFQEWVKELEHIPETNKIEIENYARENVSVDKFVILIELI